MEQKEERKFPRVSRRSTVFLATHPIEAQTRVRSDVIRALLLRSGIESNPGPWRKKYPCIECDKPCIRSCLMCNTCKKWCHFGCAGVDLYTARRIWWHCWKCKNVNSKTQKEAKEEIGSLNILQLNINGLRNKTSELGCILRENNIKIAAIQETKLKPGSADSQIEGFSLFRADRTQNGGGVAIYIAKELKFSTISTNSNSQTELLVVDIHTGRSCLRIINYYLPPNADAPFEHVIECIHDKSAMIMGDANCHSKLWHSALNSDAKGQLVEELISQSNLVVKNEDTHTQLP